MARNRTPGGMLGRALSTAEPVLSTTGDPNPTTDSPRSSITNYSIVGVALG